MQTYATARDLTTLIEPLLGLCLEAGEAICRHYHAPGTTDYEMKRDDSPLTQADLESHDILQAGLRALDPSLPILSEESTEEALAGRRGWRRYWLVDPLDGTKEFIGGTGEFTINIALIDDHAPVLGVLYIPLQRRAYVGVPGALARCYSREEGWQEQSLAVRTLEQGRPLVVHASRRHMGPKLQGCLAWLGEHWGPVTRCNSGSALKFCQLAEGGGDFYPRFSPCCEWDTAAGQAVLEAAGGVILGLDGRPLRYNCRDSLLSPNFYAIADRGNPLWQQLLRRRLA